MYNNKDYNGYNAYGTLFDVTLFHPETNEEYYVEAYLDYKHPDSLEKDSDWDFYGYCFINNYEVYNSSGNKLSDKKVKILQEEIDIESMILDHFKIHMRYEDIEDCMFNNDYY